MSEEFPLYPTLSEDAKKEAQLVMDRFKEKMVELCKDALGELYCDVSMYVESDHWQNYRNKIMDGMRDYNNRKVQAEWDFKDIRKQIFKEHRKEMIPDLNQDLVEEVESLKRQIKYMQESRY